MSEEFKPRNPEISLWKTQSGNGLTAGINEKNMESLNKAALGSRIFIKMLNDEERGENANAPHARMIIFPPQEGGSPTYKKSIAPLPQRTEEDIPF